ncbi:hypothetical protein JW949_02635 [Candidatus Woesearchaeota archaeon]|nr:hypothetical protein [Candidatus Woesearchaeota archaeon]
MAKEKGESDKSNNGESDIKNKGKIKDATAKDSTKTIELGGNIVLTGFNDLDYSEMIVVKKLIGSATKKMSNHCDKIEEMKLTLKKIHEIEGNAKYELHGQLICNGKSYNSEFVDKNIYIAIDQVTKKILNELAKKK